MNIEADNHEADDDSVIMIMIMKEVKIPQVNIKQPQFSSGKRRN
jgi:hypothetical protein